MFLTGDLGQKKIKYIKKPNTKRNSPKLYLFTPLVLLLKGTQKKGTQPEALAPYNPTAGYVLDVNGGNKASICC